MKTEYRRETYIEVGSDNILWCRFFIFGIKFMLRALLFRKIVRFPSYAWYINLQTCTHMINSLGLTDYICR